MKRFLGVAAGVILLTLSVGSAGAESLKGRLGITGQVGFIAPVKSEFTPGFVAANGLPSSTLRPDTGFAGGGGLIFGLTDNVALEAGVIQTTKMDYDNLGVTALKIMSTNVSLGAQYRNNFAPDMSAYLGAGVDVLLSDVEDARGNNGDVDTVVGGHANVGGDYFLTKSLALNFDLRGVFFPEADVKGAGLTVAKYDPIGFVALFGVRFFLN